MSAHEAKRLTVTEGARIATEAERQSYIANGYDEYEFIAEPKACDICKPLDGKIFKVADMLPGENAAPMHPFVDALLPLVSQCQRKNTNA